MRYVPGGMIALGSVLAVSPSSRPIERLLGAGIAFVGLIGLLIRNEVIHRRQ